MNHWYDIASLSKIPSHRNAQICVQEVLTVVVMVYTV